MKPYPPVDDLLGPLRQVAMHRAERLYVRGGTVHVAARGKSREIASGQQRISGAWSRCAAKGPRDAHSPPQVPPERAHPQLLPEGAAVPRPHPALAELGSPAGCPRPPLDSAACRENAAFPGPLSPPARERKTCARAFANSSAWSRIDARYFSRDPYVRWCGRRGAARLLPIPIGGAELHPFTRCNPASARRRLVWKSCSEMP